MVTARATVADFLSDRRTMPKEAFLSKHSCPVLVEKAEKAGDDAGGDDDITTSFSTMVMSSDMVLAAMESAGVDTDKAVYRLVKAGSNAFRGMITVGRTTNNDIVIDSKAVSKFHAYFSLNPTTGACAVTDAASTNGTFVNGTKLTPRNPCSLDDADEVSFSRKLTFAHYSPGGWYRVLGSLL